MREGEEMFTQHSYSRVLEQYTNHRNGFGLLLGWGVNAEHKEQGMNREEWRSKTRVQQAELQHLGASQSMTGSLLVEETLRA